MWILKHDIKGVWKQWKRRLMGDMDRKGRNTGKVDWGGYKYGVHTLRTRIPFKLFKG